MTGAKINLIMMIEIDEMRVGGYCEGKIGRNLGKKTAFMIGVEKLDDGRAGKRGSHHKCP